MVSLAARLKSVTVYYGFRPILQDISCEVPVGSRVAIIGPNGVGKTTLLALLAGLITPQEGSVEVLGLRRRGSVEEELAIRRNCIPNIVVFCFFCAASAHCSTMPWSFCR